MSEPIAAVGDTGVGTDARADARTQLRLEHVGRVFPGPPTIHALRDATFSVTTGEMLAIVGRSGSGKSTLLNIVGLLDTLTSGSYLVEGAAVSALSQTRRTVLRSRLFGFVFQDSYLLPTYTAQENVELALRPRHLAPVARRATSAELLESLGLSERRRAFPSTMSGGERQRVALARALAGKPGVLLCDEPTGNLDERTSRDVLDLLRQANKAGTTVIIVTHDQEIAQSLPRVCTMRDGVLSEDSAVGARYGSRA